MSRKQWTYAKIMIELYLFGERQEKHLMRELSVSNVFSLKDYYTKIARTANIYIIATRIMFILNYIFKYLVQFVGPRDIPQFL